MSFAMQNPGRFFFLHLVACVLQPESMKEVFKKKLKGLFFFLVHKNVAWVQMY